MWNEGDPKCELRGHEVAMGRSGSEVVVLDDRVIEAANRAQPGVTNINVTKSSRLHIGPKFVSVTQNVDNTEVVKGRVLGLELVSPQNSKRLRCSIAVFVCWAFVVASGLTFLIFHFALATKPSRLDLDLPLPRYLWDIAKSTTRAERLSCAAAIVALLVCIILIVYFTVIAKKTADAVVDVAPHEWFITRDQWLAPPFLDQDLVTAFAPLKLVIVAHTVSTECTLFVNCAAELRTLQSYFATNYGYDLPYNFLIGNEGRVYEGRGWNKIGAHTRFYNRCTLGIGFIGDYREGLPSYSKVTDLQLLRAKMLLDEGVARGYLDKDYHVVGAKDVQSSLSPGANLYRAIQKWHNYAHDTNYAGKSCEDIYGINITSAAAQTATLPPTFKNLTAPHEWFITRKMWLAPPFLNQDAMTDFSPLKLVIVAHTVSSECTEFTSCAAELRMLQSYYATNMGSDIPYNFLIGNEGRVYEGRGWNRIGAHTRGYNNCTLGIGFVGDYREGFSQVTDLQLLRAKMLLEEGVARGYLDKDYHVVGTRDLMHTLSPGSNLYEAIKKWDHYAHDTNYAGKSCEDIHEVHQTSAASLTASLPQNFKSLTRRQASDLAPHEWFITREMWLAPPFLNQDAVTDFSPLKLVVVAHTVSSECTLFVNCAAEMRMLQSYYASNMGSDIPYNFLIGNEGRVYEGRGWNRIGAHTRGYNNCTLGIGFVGDYREGFSQVTDLQLLRAKMLLEEGVARGYLDKDYHVVGTRDLMHTLSPGSNLYEAIKKWDHYAHDTNYAGKSCEDIHEVHQSSAASQTASLPQTFKSLTRRQASDLAPHEWFITREMWLAPPFLNQDAVTDFSPLKLVIVHHTVSSECTLFVNCAAEMRSLQYYFAGTIGSDIPYNFLIGNEGRVYEGRGWNRIGAHTRGYNNCTLGIAFIGDYREGLPSYSQVTELQLLRAKMLLDEGVGRGFLDKDYHVVGAKDVINTQSPGSNLYEAIKKWDHYAHDTNYAGKSCEDIHEVHQTSAASQTASLPQTFKSLTRRQASDLAPHEWFITREMWLAPPFLNQDAVTDFSPLKLVIVHHTVSSECTLFVNCAAEMRSLQYYFAGTIGSDIPYNFLIGNEGRVYEGRGWNRIGAHTRGYNNCTLGIAFIGDYRDGLPSYSQVTELQLLRAKMLLDEGVGRGFLDKDYHVVGAKDVINTQSPGSNLYEAIKKWDHYAHETNYAGKSCEDIHEVHQTSAASQTASLPQTFKSLTRRQASDLAPHEWFITREMWLAPPFLNQDAVTDFSPLKLVIVHHTVSSECTLFVNCAAEMRSLQYYFAGTIGSDIPYNFLIGNEGRVYEGRGWNRIGAHTRGYNNCTLGIAFIGDYREGLPSYSQVTELQLLRAKMLLDEGVGRGFLDKDYHVVGAKDVINTQSPGSNLYEAIKKWDHYAHETNYAGKSCEDIHGVNQTSATDPQIV